MHIIKTDQDRSKIRKKRVKKMSNFQDLQMHIQMIMNECRDQIPDINQTACKEIIQSIESVLQTVSYPSSRLELRKLLRNTLDPQNSKIHTQEIIDICFPSTIGPFSVWPRKDAQSIKPVHSNLPRTFPLKTPTPNVVNKIKNDSECFKLHVSTMRTKTNHELYELIRDYQPSRDIQNVQNVAPSAENIDSSENPMDHSSNQETSQIKDVQDDLIKEPLLIDFRPDESIESQTHSESIHLNHLDLEFDIHTAFYDAFKFELSKSIHEITNAKDHVKSMPILLPMIHGSFWREANYFISILLDQMDLKETNPFIMNSKRMKYTDAFILTSNNESIKNVLYQSEKDEIILVWKCNIFSGIINSLSDCERLEPLYIHSLSVNQQRTIWNDYWKCKI